MDGAYYYGEVDDADGAVLIAETAGTPDKSSVTIGSIKLKVKSNAITTTEAISLSEISVLDDAEEVYEIDDASDINITINAISNSETETEAAEEQSKNENTNENIGKLNTYNSASTANQSAPYTGVEDVAPIIFAVTVIAIVAFIGIIKYREIK